MSVEVLSENSANRVCFKTVLIQSNSFLQNLLNLHLLKDKSNYLKTLASTVIIVILSVNNSATILNKQNYTKTNHRTQNILYFFLNKEFESRLEISLLILIKISNISFELKFQIMFKYY